ncbi:MAG: GNAT family N-acetyltransferase [Nitrospirota bacterium]
MRYEVPLCDGVLRMALTVRFITHWSEFLAWKERWNRHLDASPQRDNVMLRHEWFTVWWMTFGEGKDLWVAAVFDGDRLVGLAPLMRSARRYGMRPLRVISFIENEHTNRAEFIVGPDEQDGVVRALWLALQAHRTEWDLVVLDYFPDGPLSSLWLDTAATLGYRLGRKRSYHSPYIPLTNDWDAYYGGLKGHFKRNLKNRAKRLNQLGTLTYERYPSEGRELKPFLEELFDVGAKSWKEADESAIASTPALKRFYGDLAVEADRQGWLSLHVLKLDDRPVVFHYSLRYRGRLFLLKTEYDLAYATYAPGHLLQKEVIEEAYREGMTEFDFLGPSMTWKLEWTDQVRPHGQLWSFNRGWRPTMVFAEKMVVKPWVKRLLNRQETF